MKAKFPVSSFQFLPAMLRIALQAGQRSLNACSGVALIGIIIAIVVMGMIGGSVLMLITTGSMESLQAMNWNKAFCAAESGISKAKEYMSTNASWYVNLNMAGMTIGNASFSNIITTNATSTVITSTGVQGDSRWTSRWSPAGGEITRAIVVYKQTTDTLPRYRTCSNLRRLSDELTANSVSTRIRWQRIEANPRTNEFLLVVQDNSPEIWAQTYVNGEWVSNTRLDASGPPNAAQRGFDVAYENLSGRGMVVYSVGTSNPEYRVWTANGWTGPSNINVGATNPISWIRLISKPGTNEIMCLARWYKNTGVVATRGNYSSAIIWNGTMWTNYIPLERKVGAAADLNYETFDGAYASTTNQALVVYINGPTLTQPKYRTYTSAGWSAEKTNSAALGNTPRWIRVEYSVKGPTNRPPAAYAGFLLAGSSSRLQGAYYTNTLNWTDYNNFSNVNIETSAKRAFDIAWSSQTNTLMVVYSRNNQNAQSYMLVTNAGMQSAGSKTNFGNLVSTDEATDRGQWCVLKPDPFTPEFYYLAQDDNNCVNFQRWNGTAWTLFPELEDKTANNNDNFTDFAFRQDSASTNCWPLR